jgi:hypothetical protein
MGGAVCRNDEDDIQKDLEHVPVHQPKIKERQQHAVLQNGNFPVAQLADADDEGDADDQENQRRLCIIGDGDGKRPDPQSAGDQAEKEYDPFSKNPRASSCGGCVRSDEHGSSLTRFCPRPGVT